MEHSSRSPALTGRLGRCADPRLSRARLVGIYVKRIRATKATESPGEAARQATRCLPTTVLEQSLKTHNGNTAVKRPGLSPILLPLGRRQLSAERGLRKWAIQDSNNPEILGENATFCQPEAKPEAHTAAAQFSQAFALQLSQLIHPAALLHLRAWLADQDPQRRALAERILREWLGRLHGHQLPDDQPRRLPAPRSLPS